jgi:ABC-type Fe3+-hydroxamate transport system substrate-binding protein
MGSSFLVPRIMPVRFRRLSTVLVLFLWLIFLPSAQAYSRIVSLKPNITEIVFALGEGGHLVGVTRFCTRPPEAVKISRIADYVSIDVERTLAERPDLILASTENSSRKEVDFLKSRGIAVELFSFATLQDIRDSVLRLGELLKKNNEAQALVREMDRGFSQLKVKSEKTSKPRALFIVGYEPLVVVGGNNFIGETFPYLGLVNVAGESRMPYPVYSTEQLLRSSPELIVDLAMGSEATPSKKEQRKNWWRRFPSIPAVSQGRIYHYEIEKIRAVPELPQALEELFSLLRTAPSPNS